MKLRIEIKVEKTKNLAQAKNNQETSIPKEKHHCLESYAV